MYNQELSYYIVFIIIREFDDEPVYEIPPPKYQAERILKILLDLSRNIWSGYISGPAGPFMFDIIGPAGPFMLS